MRSDFVANVSHELRSPLTSLRGFIETLEGAARNDPAARARFLGVMEEQAQRMQRLIDDLLSLSKVESNERVRPTSRTDVSAMVERVISTFDVNRTNDKNIEMKSSGDLPTVPGDDDQLTQVFQNLIENAVNYAAPGTTIVVAMQKVESVAGISGPALLVEVRDQGPGIPREHIPRLTERFYRVDTGRSREKGGTGLGLAIVKHIVNRHRGRLNITSEIGVGTKVSVYLPIVDGTA